MNLISKMIVGLLLLPLLVGRTSAAESVASKSVTPLVQAHSHNDYEHTRPLLDALDQGFCSIEADIYLVDGKLLVAHELKDVKPDRTLEALYLEPLRQRAKGMGGQIYPGVKTITLLVDVKTEATATYLELDKVFQRYNDLLTRFEGTNSMVKPVTVLISGNRDYATLRKQNFRYAALDGRLPDLQDATSRTLAPLISESWKSHFKWPGEGQMPVDEKQKLLEIVQRAHTQGRKFRFWATPDRPEMWQALLDAKLDYINADDLPGLRKFLLSKSR